MRRPKQRVVAEILGPEVSKPAIGHVDCFPLAQHLGWSKVAFGRDHRTKASPIRGRGRPVERPQLVDSPKWSRRELNPRPLECDSDKRPDCPCATTVSARNGGHNPGARRALIGWSLDRRGHSDGHNRERRRPGQSWRPTPSFTARSGGDAAAGETREWLDRAAGCSTTGLACRSLSRRRALLHDHRRERPHRRRGRPMPRPRRHYAPSPATAAATAATIITAAESISAEDGGMLECGIPAHGSDHVGFELPGQRVEMRPAGGGQEHADRPEAGQHCMVAAL